MAPEDRLDEVEEQIDEARKTAEDAGILDDPDEPRYFQSGSQGKEEDDQTIAPPG